MTRETKKCRNSNDDNNTTIREISTKNRASHPSSNSEPVIDYRKLGDKLKPSEITVKLDETEILKLQFVNEIQTTTSHTKNIQDPDCELAKFSIYTNNSKI